MVIFAEFDCHLFPTTVLCQILRQLFSLKMNCYDEFALLLLTCNIDSWRNSGKLNALGPKHGQFRGGQHILGKGRRAVEQNWHINYLYVGPKMAAVVDRRPLCPPPPSFFHAKPKVRWHQNGQFQVEDRQNGQPSRPSHRMLPHPRGQIRRRKCQCRLLGVNLAGRNEWPAINPSNVTNFCPPFPNGALHPQWHA